MNKPPTLKNFFISGMVITKAKTKCYSNCKNPIQVPGKCCPICQGTLH